VLLEEPAAGLVDEEPEPPQAASTTGSSQMPRRHIFFAIACMKKNPAERSLTLRI
jgi:hypothetical protein